MAQETQEYMRWSQESNQRMEDLAKESEELLKRMEYTQQLLDTWCARKDMDASNATRDRA